VEQEAVRSGRGFHRRWRLDGVTLLVAVVLVAIAALAATHGVSAVEARLFHAVNDLPDWLERPMWLAQLLGLLLTPLVFALIAVSQRAWRLATLLVVLIPLKLLVEKGVIKELVFRARPGTSICAGDDSCLHARGVPMVGPSFPSGHVMVMCGIAWLIAPDAGRPLRWNLVVPCLLVAASRIYLGAHNPLDVAAGAAAGVAIGAALNLIAGVPGRREQ
jgi:undecaprenyl-diphosphatase